MRLIDEVYRFICKAFSIATKHSFIIFSLACSEVLHNNYIPVYLCSMRNLKKIRTYLVRMHWELLLSIKLLFYNGELLVKNVYVFYFMFLWLVF